jgi:isopenicillin-N epimerase
VHTDWLLDPDVAYLNHGGFGALPGAVAAAAAELRAMMERDPSDLLMRRLPAQLDDVRSQLAALLHADEAGCVFVANATAGVATVLTAFAPMLAAGDEILVVDHRYHAVEVQLDALGDRCGVRTVLAHVPLDVRTPADVVSAVAERMTGSTRLLVIDAIASASGFVFPVAELVVAAHDRGIPVLVDAAHAPGQVAVDLRATDADFWVGNLHKWICSPRAAAILSVAPQWRDRIRPLVASHRYADGYQPAFDWTGTFDPVPLLAVPAALAFWDALGWDDVRARQQALVDEGAARVATALGTCAPVAGRFSAAMRIVALPTALSSEAALEVEKALCDTHRIEVSVTSLHDRTWVRVCGQVYNTPADYDRLADALPGLVGAR